MSRLTEYIKAVECFQTRRMNIEPGFPRIMHIRQDVDEP